MIHILGEAMKQQTNLLLGILGVYDADLAEYEAEQNRERSGAAVFHAGVVA